jgi:hypothetical protein
MSSWTKEANDNDLKMTFIQGKKKAKGKEPGGMALPQSIMRWTMNCLHQLAKQMLPGIGNVNLD